MASAGESDRMEVEDVEEEEEDRPKVMSYRDKLRAGAPQIVGLGPDPAPLKPQKGKTAQAAPASATSSSPAPTQPLAQVSSSSSAELLSVPESRWHIIYPLYINATRTIAEGRRISKAKAVEGPTIQEMVDSCTFLKVPVIAEPEKAYPRDYLWSADRGRIRVQLKDARGVPINPEIPNKMELMLKLGALIPKHHGRTRKDGKDAKKEPSEKDKKGAAEKEKKGRSGKKKK